MTPNSPSGGGVYDPEEKSRERTRRLWRRSEEKDPRKKRITDKASSPQQLSRAERAAADSLRAIADLKDEKAKIDSGVDDDGFYDEKSPRRRKWSRRKKMVTGGAGIIGGGAIGMLLMGIGPFQFIHLAQNLQDFHFGNNESMMDGRVSRIINYGRHNRHRGNLGIIGNQVADIYERKLARAGLRADYRDPVTGRPTRAIQSFNIDVDSPQGQKVLADLRANGVDIPDPTPGTRTINIPLRRRGSNALSRSIIRSSLKSLGINSVSSWMGGRLLITRGGVSFHRLSNKAREVGEGIRDYFRRTDTEYRESTADYTSDGSQNLPDDARRPAENPDDPDGDNVRQQAGAEGDKIVVPGDPEATAGRLRGVLTSAGLGLFGFATLVCALDSFGDGIGAIMHANVVLPLMRIGVGTAISIGNQVMANQDLNAYELGAASRQLWDSESGSWAAAKSIQAEWGVPDPGGPDMPEAAKPGKDKPAFFETIDSVVSDIPAGEQICDFLTSPAGEVIGFGADAIAAAFSGGLSGVAVSAGGELAGNIAGRAAEPFIQNMATWLAGDPVEEFAQGALFGNYANYGARLGANDNALSMGGAELSNSEVAALDAERQSAYKTRLQHKGLYARLFDPYERGSLVATTVLRNPNLSGPQAAATGVARMPMTFLSQLGSTFSNLFVPKAQALNVANYDYGFPEYGFSLDLQNDPRYEDPFDNAQKVEDYGLKKLNDDYGDCFGTTITDDGSIVSEESRRMDEIDDGCSDNSNEMLVRYRFYIADTVAAKSMACFNSIDEGACSELGFQSSSSDDGGDTPDGLVGPEDIVDIPGLDPGQGCHKSIADEVRRMIEDAGKAGVTLTGHCWRSPEEQIELRKKNCGTTPYDIYQKPSSECNPPTAIPGTSNHEKGLAIDFDNCSSRSTACFQWLNANAARYGMYNLPSEPWHWSVDGG